MLRDRRACRVKQENLRKITENFYDIWGYILTILGKNAKKVIKKKLEFENWQ